MKKWKDSFPVEGAISRCIFKYVNKYILYIFFFIFTSTSVMANAQYKKITLSLEKVSIEEFLWEIEKKTDIVFFYGESDISNTQTINVNYEDEELIKILDDVLIKNNLSYIIEENTIVIRKSPKNNVQNKGVKIKGVIKDKLGNPLQGVTVYLKGTQTVTISGKNGDFSINIPDLNPNNILVFTFVGMKKIEMNINSKDFLNIIMSPDTNEIDEVVVTGIYSRAKETFTGSSKTYSNKELKMAGNNNIIQSLKTLDPAFTIIENNIHGSDPNKLPDIEIRGKSSIVGFKEKFGQDPNQPLFILDGFETTLQTIMDLNLDRVKSVTLLKDAVSTAIYGAKAANGVVVVETKSPEKGKVRLSYYGNYYITYADLSDYNLMNSQEKLEFEKQAGSFKTNLAAAQEQLDERYYSLLKDVKRGVDTYWLSEPLRIALNHRHNLYLDGGDEQMRYGLGVTLSNIDGVMKKSFRDIFSVNLDLIYRNGKLSFMNKLSIDYNELSNPIVAFHNYSRTNPYYEKYNNGGVDKWLESRTYNNVGGVQYRSFFVPNPMWNDRLNSYNKGSGFSVRNSFSMEYSISDFLVSRVRLGINKYTSESESFSSPEDTKYEKIILLRRGSYSNSRGDGFSYDGDVTLTYGQVLGTSHQINIAMGASINEYSSKSKGYNAQGFPEGEFSSPGFANTYPDGTKPQYNEGKNRGVNFFFNGGYSYDKRYLFDINLRSDGTSIFGSNNRFSTTWSIGVAWNLHNENFIMNNIDFFNMLKLRFAIGNPGNQSFGSFNAISVYKFNSQLLNNFGTGLTIESFGDPDMVWQRTIDKNIGVDISGFGNRFHITLDYYSKNTDPLLASIGVPASVGVTSRIANVGMQEEKGINGTIRYSIVYRPKDRINWTTSINFRKGRGYYNNIGRNLDVFNRENLGKNLVRYYDGGSTSSLWSVKSAGIDPATGREIFIKKDGKHTYDYSYEDEVIVGDSRPQIEGVFGNVLYYKGLSFSVYIRYSYGGDIFNSTLHNKVENISESSLRKNQDRRALYDRWKKTGDYAKYKGISLTDFTPISSRFIMQNNYISLESVRLSYDVPKSILKKINLSNVSLSAYISDIYRISSIRNERGIDYPFARSISVSLNVTI